MRFFKLLLSDFETKLLLPPRFCTKAKGEYSTEAVVQTHLGRWAIDVGESRGRFYFHGNRWNSFARGHALAAGYLIVFEYHRRMHFEAWVFDSSACEKEFPVPQSGHEIPTRHAPPNLTFTKKICATSCSDYFSPRLARLYIPTEIWRENNLHEKEHAVLIIPGSRRREWAAKLTFYKDRLCRWGYDRLAITDGWPEFCSSNNIKKGDSCIFEIIDANPHHNVVSITVKIVTEIE